MRQKTNKKKQEKKKARHDKHGGKHNVNSSEKVKQT